MDENSNAEVAPDTGPASASSIATASTSSIASNRTASRGPGPKFFGLVLLTFVMGIVGGGWIVHVWRGPAVAEAEEHDEHEDGETLQAMYNKRYEIFDMSHAARDTLGLEVAEAEVKPFTEVVRLPAFVREIPGRSDLVASARSHGIIKRMLARQGQAIRAGDPIAELELTGDELAQTQAALLDAVQQLSIVQKEIKRLSGAVGRGGVAETKLLTTQYEQQRLNARIVTKREELGVFGLTPEQVAMIEQQQQLIRSVTIHAPSVDQESTAQLGEVLASPSDDRWVYSVEDVNVSVGQMVQAGEPIANLAYHATLWIEGQAFERDTEMVVDVVKRQKTLAAELGPDDEPLRLSNLPLEYVDNHLDPQSRSTRIYLSLPNEVSLETTHDARRYRVWKFKPNQRGHVLIPTRTWENEIPLPADAVVQDGPDHYVFRYVATHANAENPHDEFAPVRVVVLHADQSHVVIAAESLDANTKIAMNQAYRLLLTMKDQQSKAAGGGHAHHGHEH